MRNPNFLDGLLDELACISHDRLRPAALQWLHRQVRFNGAIWAHGVLAADGAVLCDWIVEECPASLVDNGVAAHLPLGPGLGTALDTLTIVRAGRGAAGLRGYLARYRIRCLLMKGIRTARPPGLAWLILLRGETGPAFEAGTGHRVSAAMSTILQACDYAGMLSTGTPAHQARAAGPAAGDGARPALALTGRQQQVLHGLMQGWSNKLIARHLAISDNTLKTHLQTIYQVMHVRSRSQAILLAMQWARPGGTAAPADAGLVSSRMMS